MYCKDGYDIEITKEQTLNGGINIVEFIHFYYGVRNFHAFL